MIFEKLTSIKNNPLIRAVFAPILFEMCGIIPIVLVTLGIINVSAGITLRNTLVFKYYLIFFFIAAGFFIYSVYLFLKQQQSCNLSGLKTHHKSVVLALLTLTFFEALVLLVIQIIEKLVYGQSLTHFYDFYGIGGFLLAIILVFILFIRLSKGEK